ETLERLASYFAKPTPTTVLVVSYRHKKVDGRRKVLKTVQDGKGVVFLSDKVKEEELPALFTQLAKRQDRKLGPDEARLLAAHLGADLAKAVKEVEKLCILTEPKGAITADMIQRVIGISREHNVFELQNAIGMRDVVKAQRIAMYFASDPRNHPLPMTIGFLHGYFTKLAIAHRMQGRNPQEMAAAMKVSPYFVKDYLAHAQNYTLGRVVMAQRLLRQMDLRSKGLGGDDDHGELLRACGPRVMPVVALCLPILLGSGALGRGTAASGSPPGPYLGRPLARTMIWSPPRAHRSRLFALLAFLLPMGL